MSEPNCNATLTTFVHTKERATDIPDGATVTRRGDSLYRDEVHEHVCRYRLVGHPFQSGSMNRAHGCARCGAAWTDATEGATPHVDPEPPLVSDEERTAAREEFSAAMSSKRPNSVEVVALDKALEAAARVRQNIVTND